MLVVIVSHSYTFFSGRYLPYIDWSNHIGLISIMAHGSNVFYEVSASPKPYFLFYACTALIAQFVSVTAAAKVSLILASALMTISAASLAEVCGRSPRIAAFLAPMALFGVSLGFGFGAFVTSLPLALFAFAATEKVLLILDESNPPLDRRTLIRRLGAMGLWIALAFLGHAMVFLLTSLLIIVRVLLFALFRARDWQKSLRSVLIAATAFLPAMIVASPSAILVLATKIREAGVATTTSVMSFLPREQQLAKLGGDLLERGSPEHWTTMYLVVVLFGLYLLISLFRSHPDRPRLAGLEIYAGCLLIIYLFGPVTIEWPTNIWIVHQRYATLAALFVLLLPRTDLTGWFGGSIASLGLALTIHNAHVNAKQVRWFSNLAKPYDGVRKIVPEGVRYLALTVTRRSDVTRLHPAMGSLYFYHLDDGAAYSAFLFDHPLVPVVRRPDVEMPRAPFWRTPHAFDPRTHGVDHDYLILRGPALVQRTERAGLHEKVADVSGWVVFKTKNPTPWPTGD